MFVIMTFLSYDKPFLDFVIISNAVSKFPRETVLAHLEQTVFLRVHIKMHNRFDRRCVIISLG